MSNNSERPVMVTWTRDMLARLRRHHAHAVDVGKKSFVMDGNEFLTAYAKYLIEHLEGVFNEQTR